ncbi:hypothetical protein CspHIS471_0609190 [Cutaneotrichosporon sp. HIS471]|nr:hypothetical protein CspHIS471_0609190 [Cutaneotrichosporon sp. HIS471]
MLIWLITLYLCLVSAAPQQKLLRHSIALTDIPANSPDYVVFKMRTTQRDIKVAYKNGDLPYAQTNTNGVTTLRNRDDYGNEFCLDAGWNPAAGNRVHLWQCYRGVTQQTWDIKVSSVENLEDNGIIRHAHIKLRDFDLCLDRNGANGQNVAVNPCVDSIEQIWNLYYSPLSP